LELDILASLWLGGYGCNISVDAYRMCSMEAVWEDHVGMSVPVCHTSEYLVLPHSVSVQLFVCNLSDIHCIIASGRAECNEICVLCNFVHDG